MCAPDDFLQNSKLVGIMYILLVTGSDPGSNSLGLGVLGFGKEGRGKKGAGIPGGGPSPTKR
jgi:hypothetical protein